MFRLYRFVMMLGLALCAWPALEANAQQNTQPRKIGADEIKRMADNNTFWEMGKLDRIFLKNDNTFVQQINDGWKNLTPGTLFHGTWEIKSDALCWTYNAETVQKFGLNAGQSCFDVYTREPARTFMTTHVEDTTLKPAGSGPTGPTIFRLNQWHHDNYVIDPAYAQQVIDGLQTIQVYRQRYGGVIPGGTINRAEMNPDMQTYYDAMVDKIFFIVGDYMFFDDSGHYYWVQARDIVAAKGNVDEMIKHVQVGKWLIKDNIHCWYVNAKTRSCEYILPLGKGLMRDYEGILGFHHSTFSRVHGEGAVGHMDPEDSESPELFKKLQDTYKGK